MFLQSNDAVIVRNVWWFAHKVLPGRWSEYNLTLYSQTTSANSHPTLPLWLFHYSTSCSISTNTDTLWEFVFSGPNRSELNTFGQNQVAAQAEIISCISQLHSLHTAVSLCLRESWNCKSRVHLIPQSRFACDLLCMALTAVKRLHRQSLDHSGFGLCILFPVIC